jgi:hypothetical protein
MLLLRSATAHCGVSLSRSVCDLLVLSRFWMMLVLTVVTFPSFELLSTNSPIQLFCLLCGHLCACSSSIATLSHAAPPSDLPFFPWWITLSRNRPVPHTQSLQALAAEQKKSLAAEMFHSCDSPLHHAFLLSLQCWHAGAYTLPQSFRIPDALIMTSSKVVLVQRAPTHMSPQMKKLIMSSPKDCTYRHHHFLCIQGRDTEHAMSCNHLSGSRLRRRDHWNGALIRNSARLGCHTHTEHSCTSVGVVAASQREASIEVTVGQH